jgi:hypothetical protein
MASWTATVVTVRTSVVSVTMVDAIVLTMVVTASGVPVIVTGINRSPKARSIATVTRDSAIEASTHSRGTSHRLASRR